MFAHHAFLLPTPVIGGGGGGNVITGWDAPIEVINSTDNVRYYSGTFNTPVGDEYVVLHVLAWGGSSDMSNWVVTIDGNPVGYLDKNYGTSITNGAMLLCLPTPGAGTHTLDIDTIVAGRACKVTGWALRGHDAASPVASHSMPDSLNTNTSSLAMPAAGVPVSRDGNVVLVSMGIKGAITSYGTVVTSGLDQSAEFRTGTNNFSDINGFQGGALVDPMTTIFPSASWSEAARPYAVVVEINVAP